MIFKLPRWVWLGALLLAFVAGMINVVGLLGFEHEAVSHMSGNTTQLGVAVVTRNHFALARLLSALGAFLAGAALCGYLIQTTALQLGRHYGTVLLLETFLLVTAIYFLQHDSHAGLPLLCMACGLQNAMASTYSGAIIRTTHVTGVLTDLGVLIGQSLRGLPRDRRRFALFGAILAGFFCGSVAAALLFPPLAYKTLLVPAAITGVSSIGYMLFEMSKQKSPERVNE